jgi:uncharacterized protein (DUF302 family)
VVDIGERTATTTYWVAGSFEETIHALREAMALEDLELAGELDVANRLREKLLVGTAPCRVLFVSAKAAGDLCVAALLPLHIVISAAGSQTEIHVMRKIPAEDGQSAMVLRQLQIRVARAIEKIGMRASL